MRKARLLLLSQPQCNFSFILVIRGFASIISILIVAGSEINSVDRDGNTALHLACLNGNVDAVDLLLKRPSVNSCARNNGYKSPLELASNFEIKMLFEEHFKAKKASMVQSKDIPIKFADESHVEALYNNIKRKISYGDQCENEPFLRQSELSSSMDFSTSDEENKISPSSFRIHSVIGKGSFGEVYLVHKVNSPKFFAMKVINKDTIIKHNLVRYAKTERNVLQISHHPFIVKLIYAFQSNEELFLILQYCSGGDLSVHLKREKCFPEDKARFYAAEILLALEYLHKQDIVYRDLKPSNVILDEKGHAHLTDFGLSKEGISDAVLTTSFCGSMAYLAPEMLKKTGHGKSVDWYLFGVLLHEMLTGSPPFIDKNREEMFYNIENKELILPPSISREASSILRQLLTKNPLMRLGATKADAEEIKSHPFFSTINWNQLLKKFFIEN